MKFTPETIGLIMVYATLGLFWAYLLAMVLALKVSGLRQYFGQFSKKPQDTAKPKRGGIDKKRKLTPKKRTRKK